MSEIALRQPGAFTGKLSIDATTGIIGNVSVLTAGPAKGHGFVIDGVMLNQVAAQINSAGGVPARLSHEGDGALTLLGRLRNARVEGERVRGDLHVGDYARHSPSGDLHSYVFGIAKTDPTLIGLSIIFEPGQFEQQNGISLGRSKAVTSADVVGQPAANPQGLLSRECMTTQTGSTTTTTAPVAETGDAVALETKRVTDIRGIANLYNLGDAFATTHIALQTTAEDFRKVALKQLAKAYTSPGAGISHEIHVGDDQRRAGLTEAVEQAIQIKMGLRVAKPHERLREFSGRPLHNIIELWLNGHDIDTRGLSREKVLMLASAPSRVANIGPRVIALAQSTDDFDNLLANVTSKSLRMAYQEAPRTHTLWTRPGVLPDFKPGKRIALSGAPDLERMDEGGETKYSVISDGAESITLAEYRRGLRFTWRAQVNDDLNGLGNQLSQMALAARRKEDDVAYAIITANAALSDGVALFHATHANLDAVAAAISITSLASGRLALRKQKGPASQILNLVPRFLIVPAALESIAYQYTSSAYTPTQASNVNSFADGAPTPLIPVVEPRLDANSAIKWYLAAGSEQIDTVEVAHLESEPEPVLFQEIDFDTQDQKFAVRHTVGAKALDFRGLYNNPGA